MANEIGFWTGSPSGHGFTGWGSQCQANVGGSSVYTAPSGATITKVRAWVYGTTGTQFYISLYTVSAGLPNTKVTDLYTGTIGADSTEQMVESGTLSQALTNGVQYCLACQSITGITAFGISAQANGISIDDAHNPPPASWTHDSYDANLLYLAGDITVAAGGGTNQRLTLLGVG